MAALLEAVSHRIAHTAPETGRAVRMARTTKPTGRLQLTCRVYRDPVVENHAAAVALHQMHYDLCQDSHSMTATITCPRCGHTAVEAMPTDHCVFFYECLSCRVVLRPKPGHCCVFCSYADRRCPPQTESTRT